ncbi:hypothetical protein MTO96_022531 [Rhipicephalus appendiculatus]
MPKKTCFPQNVPAFQSPEGKAPVPVIGAGPFESGSLWCASCCRPPYRNVVVSPASLPPCVRACAVVVSTVVAASPAPTLL